MQVLALSSSRVGNGTYLSAAAPMVRSFLGNKPLQVAFVPFAAVDGNYEDYAARVQEGLAGLPYSIEVATPATAKQVIESCDAIMVGGGNTFKLLHDIYQLELFPVIQQKVQNGLPYIGWSAGANLAGLTICTTNDMPIVQPQRFSAFGFFPFQINPHYYNLVVEGFHGETRDQRLEEFLVVNPGVVVVGLPEGTALQLTENRLQLLGKQTAVLFRGKANEQAPAKQSLSPGVDLTFLMQP